MLNLLTESAQHDARREYRLRLAAVACLCIGAEVLVAVAGGALSFFASRVEGERLVAEEAAKRSAPSASQGGFEEAVADTRARLAVLGAPPHEALSGALIVLAAARTKDIRLTQFSAEPLSEGGWTVSVGGVAAHRDALAAFERAVQAERRFAQVSLPLGSFAKEKESSFTLRAQYRDTLP